MFESLNKLKKLPIDTKIYCGHEYSKSNADFALSIEKNNNKLIKKSEEINKLVNENSFTVPTTVENEIECNPFLRADDDSLRKNLEMENVSPEKVFAEIRKRKDNF